jgi:hypothetical protein
MKDELHREDVVENVVEKKRDVERYHNHVYIHNHITVQTTAVEFPFALPEMPRSCLM